MLWGRLFMVWTRPSSSCVRKLEALWYETILDNSALPNFFYQFGEGYFNFGLSYLYKTVGPKGITVDRRK